MCVRVDAQMKVRERREKERKRPMSRRIREVFWIREPDADVLKHTRVKSTIYVYIYTTSITTGNTR